MEARHWVSVALLVALLVAFTGVPLATQSQAGAPNKAEPEEVISSQSEAPVLRGQPALPTGAQAGVADAGMLPWQCGTEMNVTQDRDNPSATHRGSDRWAWDFGNATVGWPIYAARDGIIAIVETSYRTGSGCRNCKPYTANRVVVDHGDGTAALYQHLAQETPPRLQVGDRVRAGVDVIGYADTTGFATGPHLHYAVQTWNSSWNGQAGKWYQPSIESLFSDPNVASVGGNPRWPNRYHSGNCATANDPRLTLTVNERRPNCPVTIELRRTSGFGQLLGPVFVGTATTDASGVIRDYVLRGVTPGTYHLLVKPRSWLRKQISNVNLVSGSNVLSWNYDTPGDGNDNNKVDEFDYGLLIQEFDTTSARSDFNGDGIVDEFDYGMLIAHFGEYGDGGAMTPVYGASLAANANPPQGQLTLAPAGVRSHAAANSVEVGDIVTLSLGFDTAGLPMAGTEVVIDYDPGVLELREDDITDSGVFGSTSWFLSPGSLEYQAHKWVGVNPGPSVSGSGELAQISFKMITGVPDSTTVAIRFEPGSTVESNMLEDSAIRELLGGVTNYVLYPRGTPERAARTALVTSPSTGAAMNQNAVVLEAETSDPCDGIDQVTFYAFYDGQWNEVGTDSDGTNGWAVYWDANPVSDQTIRVKAFAGDMAGNGVEAPVNDNILLDREPPSVASLLFDPVTAVPGEAVAIMVNATDNLAGISNIDVYVDPSTDGTTPWGSWDLVGSMAGPSGSLTWDTSGYAIGSHQIVLALEDSAGNAAFSPLPSEEPLAYEIVSQKPTKMLFLPLVLRNH